MPAIETSALGKSFGPRRAVWDLTLSVERGEVFGLLGPNGAGKTTTLRVLSGLLRADAGSAVVAGCRVAAGRPGGSELRRKVGLLTEQPGFYDRLGAAENLVYFARLCGLGRHEAESRSRKLLDRFGLAGRADAPFGSLSRGMKQKLAIARALVHEPEVILLDEPTVGLDPEATREVRATVAELAAEKRTLVLCTHDLDEVERLCGRAAFVAGTLLGIHEVRPLAARVLRVELLEPPPPLRLESVAGVREVRASGLRIDVELATAETAADVIAALSRAGARVLSAAPLRDPLEAAYLDLLAQARAQGLAA